MIAQLIVYDERIYPKATYLLRQQHLHNTVFSNRYIRNAPYGTTALYAWESYSV